MLGEIVEIAAGIDPFTGYEQTRIGNLLTFLAYLSIIVWAIVILSICIRFCARLLSQRRNAKQKQHMASQGKG